MLPLSLFRIPSFTGVQLGAFAIAGSQFALFLYLTLYLQNILGLSPLEAGVRYLPLTVVSFFVAPLSGQLMNRVQPRFLIGGGLLLAGFGLILMSGVEEGDTWTTLLPGFILGGIGIGLLNPPIAAVSVSVVERAQSGMAAGINNTFRQVGISVGIAAYGAIFLDRAGSEIADRVPGADSHGLAEAVSSGNLPAGPENIVHAAREGFFAGFNEILLIGGGLAFAGAVRGGAAGAASGHAHGGGAGRGRGVIKLYLQKWRWYQRNSLPWNRLAIHREFMKRGAFVRWPVEGNVLEAFREGRLEVGEGTLFEPHVWITCPGEARIRIGAGTLPQLRRDGRRARAGRDRRPLHVRQRLLRDRCATTASTIRTSRSPGRASPSKGPTGWATTSGAARTS